MLEFPMLSRLALAVALVACGKASDGDPTTPSSPAAPPTSPTGVVGSPAAPGAKPAPSRGPEHAVYSLVDNRLSAHLSRGGGLVVPGGSAGFAKYVRFGNQLHKKHMTWDLRESDGDLKVARMTGKIATVFVPLTAEQAKRGKVRIRIDSKSKGTLSLRVNDDKKKEINAQVDKGWQTVEIDAAGQLEGGENTLAIYTKKSGSTVAWIQVGASTGLPDDATIGFYDTGDKALTIPKDGAMSWFVEAPEKGRLVANIKGAGCKVSVSALGDDGTSTEGALTGEGGAVDLAAVGGRAIRLDLAASGCDRAAVTDAALVVPGAAPVAPKRGAAPKHVLFVIMDSLRADKIKIFDPKARPETPTFDTLAKTSAVFENHYVQGTESQVSHASMWTSMYLAKHHAKAFEDHLPLRYVTIDDVAKKAGKFVAGVSANGYIRPSRGFGNAWDKFINHIEKGGGLHGSDVIARGLGYIEPVKNKAWFLYLGLIDTHVTWRAKSPWIEKYDGGGYKGRFEKNFGDNGAAKGKLTDKEKRHVRAIYDSNVSYQDDQLGKLIDKLKEWGDWNDTMLIVTADHGDELWEDGKTFGHARKPLQIITHVPMLIHYPPLFPAGKVMTATEAIDIVPTIADALGVAADPEWQGTSMIPVAEGQVEYPRLAVASQYENAHAGRLGAYKIRIKGGDTPVLYRVEKDPFQHEDLWGKSPIAERLLLDPMWMLRQWNTAWKQTTWGNPANVTSRFAADMGE